MDREQVKHDLNMLAFWFTILTLQFNFMDVLCDHAVHDRDHQGEYHLLHVLGPQQVELILSFIPGSTLRTSILSSVVDYFSELLRIKVFRISTWSLFLLIIRNLSLVCVLLILLETRCSLGLGFSQAVALGSNCICFLIIVHYEYEIIKY